MVRSASLASTIATKLKDLPLGHDSNICYVYYSMYCQSQAITDTIRDATLGYCGMRYHALGLRSCSCHCCLLYTTMRTLLQHDSDDDYLATMSSQYSFLLVLLAASTSLACHKNSCRRNFTRKEVLLGTSATITTMMK